MTVHRVILTGIIILVFSAISVHAQQKVTTPQYFQEFSEAQQSTNAAYNNSLDRLALQFGSSIFIGAGGGILGGLASTAFVPNEGNSASGFANMGAFILGGYVSYTVFSSLGTYIVVNNQQYDASFGNILLGNLVGSAAGLGGLFIMGKSSAEIGAVFAFAFPVIGGMIANSLSIDKRSTNSTAVVNISGDNTSLSTPTVKLTQINNSLAPQDIYSPTVKLLNISL